MSEASADIGGKSNKGSAITKQDPTQDAPSTNTEKCYQWLPED